MVHELELNPKNPEVPFVDGTKHFGDFILHFLPLLHLLPVALGALFGASSSLRVALAWARPLTLSPTSAPFDRVGWHADEPEEFLTLLKGQHLVQQGSTFQEVVRALKATLSDPFLAETENKRNLKKMLPRH